MNSENLWEIEASFLSVPLNEPTTSVEGWLNVLTDMKLPSLEFKEF